MSTCSKYTSLLALVDSEGTPVDSDVVYGSGKKYYIQHLGFYLAPEPVGGGVVVTVFDLQHCAGLGANRDDCYGHTFSYGNSVTHAACSNITNSFNMRKNCFDVLAHKTRDVGICISENILKGRYCERLLNQG